MDGIAIAIAEHLKFDMARIAKVFFEIDRHRQRRPWPAPGLLHQAFQLIRPVADLHPRLPLPLAALMITGIADRLGNLCGFLGIGNRAVAARHQRQTERAGGALCLHLVAHGADMFGLGADPGDAVCFDDFGELGIFGEEPIAGMDRIGMGDFRRRYDRGDIQIAVLGRGRANADGVIGQPHMHGIGIGSGMHRHCFDPHFMCGAVNAQRDFAAIGDQQPGNAHDAWCLKRLRPAAGQIRPAGRCRPELPSPFRPWAR